MKTPFPRSPEFRKVLAGDPHFDLARVALEIAADAHPDLDPQAALGAIDAYADRARARCPAGAKARQILGQINWVLFVEEGFRGNELDYYDPENSFLDAVIGRKTGIPITLAILYRAVASRLDLTLEGVNLPAHFMLRAVGEQPALFVDAFDSGALLDLPACRERVIRKLGGPVVLPDGRFEPCPAADVVARMLLNLKAIYLREPDFAAALPFQRRLAALHSRDPIEQRDLGMFCLQVDRPGEAVDPLRRYLVEMPGADDAEVVGGLLKAALREVALRN